MCHLASLAVLGSWGMQPMGKHTGHDCHLVAEAQVYPQYRDSTCEAASTAVCFLFLLSHDFNCFLLHVCLLNSLLRRTCLSFPPFSLPWHLCSPLFPLPRSLTSASDACPHGPQSTLAFVVWLHFHQALRQMDLLFLLLFSRQIVSLPHGSTVDRWKGMQCLPYC